MTLCWCSFQMGLANILGDKYVTTALQLNIRKVLLCVLPLKPVFEFDLGCRHRYSVALKGVVFLV